MYFEWCKKKNISNRKKHGISFESACFVFHDTFVVSIFDERHPSDEERWQSLGLVSMTVIYVAHTIREDSYEKKEIIRIISARAATPSEERRYYNYRQYREGN